MIFALYSSRFENLVLLGSQLNDLYYWLAHYDGRCVFVTKLLEKKQIVAILSTNWLVLNITKQVPQWQCVCTRQEKFPSL
jgi:hypothetical protein